jgi:hypothetical protein
MQVGTPEEVFERPDSVEVASFLGNPPMNLVPGELDGRTLVVGGHRVALPHDHAGGPRPVTVGIRPGDVRIDGEGLPAAVYLTELLGETMIVNLRFGEQLIKARLLEKRRFQDGDDVRISFNLPNVHLFDRASGERLTVTRKGDKTVWQTRSAWAGSASATSAARWRGASRARAWASRSTTSMRRPCAG